MVADIQSAVRKFWQTLGAIKTGVVLLIAVVIVSAAGTVILQRPATDADDLQRAYSPQMLRLLDALGLTNVFHAWWFVLLLVLVSASIIAASIQRFPNSWRYFSRPYKSPDDTFRKAAAMQAEIAIPDEETGLAAAERAFQRAGLKSERLVRENSFSLFAERFRISELAVYIVHASLLLIFFGGIVDALYSWSGFVALSRGESSSQIELRNGTTRSLPFSIRCDAAGEEKYADGTPKRWWSKLAVVDAGRDVLQKEIVVNDPLVYHGVRFYQASYGNTGKVEQLTLAAAPTDGRTASKEIRLALSDTVALDADTSVRFAEFIPDYVVADGQIYARSSQVENPAVHLVMESKKSGRSVDVWLPAIAGFEQSASSPYQFKARDLQLGYFTGLQVSHEPGQWAVWAGVILMGFGLAAVFYLVHARCWAVPVRNRRGQMVLWLGGTANRNRDSFEQRFQRLVEEIESEVKLRSATQQVEAQATSMAAR